MPASKPSPRAALGEYIAQQRERLGLTQSQLADRAGLTRAYMNSVERGKLGLPGVEQRRALATALRVRHVDLLLAAGELEESELSAPVYRDFVRHPELMRQVENLDAATADTLGKFLAHFQVALDEARAPAPEPEPDEPLIIDHETHMAVPPDGLRSSTPTYGRGALLPDEV